jgi:DHA1 family multidrug resistance protein-like MFS transporter
MTDLIREAALGQLIRLFTRNRFLKYPEEELGFTIPWSDIVDEKDTEPVASGIPDGQGQARRPTASRVATERSLPGLQPITSRSISRQQTTPWSAERFEIEREEALERAQSAVIQPQKTTDGVTLIDWYTTDDPANPQNWSFWKKAFVALQIWLYTFVVYCGSAIYTSSEPEIMHVFGVGQSKASLGLSMYVLGYGFGPMLFSPLSEVPILGRNVPYITSFALFVILAVPTALVDNFAGLLVLRFLTGFMGSPCLATGGATMQDIYSLLKLPYALTAWVAAAFSAPALGPLLSGFAVTAKGWRWSLWEILWMSGPVFVLMFCAFPETSAANILLRRARRLRAMTGDGKLQSQSEIDQGNKSLSTVVTDTLVRPLQITIQDPAVLFTNVYTSLIYGYVRN